MASDLLSGRSPAARARFAQLDPAMPPAISVITQAEILFGLEKKPEAWRVRAAFESFLDFVQILPWARRKLRLMHVYVAGCASPGKLFP